MGEPFEAIARLLGLLLAAAGLATGLATAPALLGQVELAGVEETEATLDGWLATRAARLRRGLAGGFEPCRSWLRAPGRRANLTGLDNRRGA